jgi:hypothetical protein
MPYFTSAYFDIIFHYIPLPADGFCTIAHTTRTRKHAIYGCDGKSPINFRRMDLMTSLSGKSVITWKIDPAGV